MATITDFGAWMACYVGNASELSKGFPQMRVDFYEIDRKIYFGEITLTSNCGRMIYFTQKCLDDLGLFCKRAVEELGLK